MDQLNIKTLKDAGARYSLEECLGTGVYAKVYRGVDNEEGKRSVAVKTVTLNNEHVEFIKEEYRILKSFSNHPSFPNFYNICKSNSNGVDEVWFIMELCEGGPVTDFVNGLKVKNRRIAEEHIAFILKQVVKALIHLHENGVIHRDVKGSNILLTKEGEVKLIDFGLSRCLTSNLSKTMTFVGSPSWIAPEVINSHSETDVTGYDSRADVWSLGITALELAHGKAPYDGMNPTKALFQIIRNPPPRLDYLNNWSEEFIDFVNECLIKTAEHRPYILEVIEHPFLTQIPENDYHFTQELKVLNQQFGMFGKEHRSSEVIVQSNLLKCEKDAPLEKMHVEDLASMSKLNEGVILQVLEDRVQIGQFYVFVGDILLALNNSEQPDVFSEEKHQRYQFKSRSDNAPHIYAVADAAYQAALHQKMPQNIILSGESASGKTRNFLHLIDHLLYLGRNNNINQERIKDAIKLIHAFTHAATPTNDYSTRCIMRTELTFSETGKNTGAVFDVYQMDKWRVSSTDMLQANYHILYYFCDGLNEMGQLDKYKLEEGKLYRYLRKIENSKSNRPLNTPSQNAKKFQKIQEMLGEFQFTEEETEAVFNVLASVINLGEVKFIETDYAEAAIENQDAVTKVAELLRISKKKITWALLNYCAVDDDNEVIPQKHTCDQARDARDSLANALYTRLVQYVVWVINDRLSLGRAVFGEKHSIKVFDMYGFESFKKNHFPQFLINCFNEELQYHYVQKVFGWEASELKDEKVPFTNLRYYNNREALEEMLGKSGVLALIDEASKQGKPAAYVTHRLKSASMGYINKIQGTEFCVNHYTGKVTYDCKEMPDRNREYLPPEVVQTMQDSENAVIKSLFSNQIDKTGNLCFSRGGPLLKSKVFAHPKKTSASSFKALSLKLLHELSVGGGTGGTHFVRCIRSDLQNVPKGFSKNIVKQQVKALSVLETAEARQCGYPYRITFAEFMRRYKYLAFDFNENVDNTRENCRLLLVRLNMEGWAIGISKVLLKYYNEEYLSRYYEKHVKKIIKIQSMIRTYLAKRSIAKKTKEILKGQQVSENSEKTQDEAASIVQKAYRDYMKRKLSAGKDWQLEVFDKEVTNFIRGYYTKWKAKSIFQILLQYRAARYMDLYNLSQQVHLYNQNSANLLKQQPVVNLDQVETRATVDLWLGVKKQPVLKIPFRLDEVPYFDTSRMCDSRIFMDNERLDEDWDAPLHWKEDSTTVRPPSPSLGYASIDENFHNNDVLEIPYSRSPNQQFARTPSPTPSYSNEKYTSPIRTSLATKDFEYISIPKQPVKKVAPSCALNPITELELKGIKNASTLEDDPPYNFQAMLRKTNFRKNIDSGTESKIEAPVVKVTPPFVKNFEEPKVIKDYENVCLKNSLNKQNTIKLTTDELPNDEKRDDSKNEVFVKDVKKNCSDSITTFEVDCGVFLEGYEICI